MATTDVIVIGAGLIGLAVARELHRQGLRATVFEAGAAGRQASWAGAGMLAGYQTTHPALRPLAIASARLYPTWVRELEAETYLSAGYRPSGTLFIAGADHAAPALALDGWERLDGGRVASLEPELRCGDSIEAWRVPGDHSVDNRALTAALLAAVRARGIEVREGARIEAVERTPEGMAVHSGGNVHRAVVVVNAAGAWSGGIPAPVEIPVRPRKGQMLRLQYEGKIGHVIAAPGVYLVPRAPGQILAGATLEDVGFAPEVEPDRIEDLRARAAAWAPCLAGAVVEETWTGFRPCAADELPILGPTRCPGYWIATAHFRDGILLAPITAKIIAHAIASGRLTEALDVTPFLPRRFERER